MNDLPLTSLLTSALHRRHSSRHQASYKARWRTTAGAGMISLQQPREMHLMLMIMSLQLAPSALQRTGNFPPSPRPIRVRLEARRRQRRRHVRTSQSDTTTMGVLLIPARKCWRVEWTFPRRRRGTGRRGSVPVALCSMAHRRRPLRCLVRDMLVNMTQAKMEIMPPRRSASALHVERVRCITLL